MMYHGPVDMMRQEDRCMSMGAYCCRGCRGLNNVTSTTMVPHSSYWLTYIYIHTHTSNMPQHDIGNHLRLCISRVRPVSRGSVLCMAGPFSTNGFDRPSDRPVRQCIMHVVLYSFCYQLH